MIGDNVEKKVAFFNLAIDTDKKEYEAILNDPECEVEKEQFKYSTPSMKQAEPLVTIWYSKEK